MKTLSALLNHVGSQCLGMDGEVNGLTTDSRKATEGMLFVAICGTQVDAHQFIPQVLESGAWVLAQTGKIEPQKGIAFVENPQQILGELASAFYDFPSKQLRMIGVTGTNGKTTIATVLFQACSSMGFPCGLISTVENKIGNRIIPSTHTTPDPISLQALLAEMRDCGVNFVFMEVSSHAIHQNRIGGIDFEVALFTNLSHDHLDYHGSFANYRDAKKLWFDQLPKTATAIVNKEDKNGMVMVQNTKARIQTYSLHGIGDYKGRLKSIGLEVMELEINGISAFFRLTGAFNASNLLAIYGAGMVLGFNAEEWIQILSATPAARGRMETIVSPKDRIIGIVDYAHTPDALKNVLETIQQMRHPDQKIHCLVGCGGNRDAEKRPIMGRIAAELADRVILTSDNPRFEDPQSILEQMWAGIGLHLQSKVLRLADRKEAIRLAVSTATARDILLVAGKGHETYQEIQGVKHDFDDLSLLQHSFQEMNR
jgi:UDP-N-acetylmuramoyl-L-alanyl-D-glutamate--2,6-diaminopimelate ligase